MVRKERAHSHLPRASPPDRPLARMLHALLDWVHGLVPFWFGLLDRWGYGGVIVLMAMESSIFPVPSEVVIPPAAYWASQGRMNIWGVIVAGTIGSYLGSAITYWISLWVGRLVVVKWGRFFFVSPEKLERAERFVHRYEAGGIFFARLLPVVRHLISIPAGIIRMNFGLFSLMTIIGSFLWCAVLAWFGMKVSRNHPELVSNPTALVHAIKHESIWIIGFIVVFCALYFLAMKLTAPKTGAE
jgi:membrane protein DedA with SNARE-associated domain